MLMKGWFQDYFDVMCDKQPNPEGPGDLWHLAAGSTKLDVYDTYLRWVNRDDPDYELKLPEEPRKRKRVGLSAAAEEAVRVRVFGS